MQQFSCQDKDYTALVFIGRIRRQGYQGSIATLPPVLRSETAAPTLSMIPEASWHMISGLEAKTFVLTPP
jgi:hypothetical protein